jgi:hypothetical protein
MEEADEAFSPLQLLKSLTDRDVRFVVIGGVAARVHGSPTATLDLDICYERSTPNLAALASLLVEVHASLRGVDPALPFHIDARALLMGDHFTFSTDQGPLDCLATPAGTTGFQEIEADAIVLSIAGTAVRFASLDHLINMKRAAGRPKDLIEIEILEALRRQLATEC